MVNIKFCGAAREVTGSAHLLTLEDGYKILLDCGMYQGAGEGMQHFNEKWLFDPTAIDCVILSHAHIDHSGRLPKLVRDGFRGPIYSTHATRSLCSIMLLDSALIQERDAEYGRRHRNRRDRDLEPPGTSSSATATDAASKGARASLWNSGTPGTFSAAPP